ncbi:precorrin-6y C5,15-methyltransferase subunit CbiE [Virgisporangium aliadipatigenens]|uniref:Precorrin-6y C5,15-methyltransferase subunit CbiE n=1 Tax=Virgisporangium aliadipatigenens TaxID=741659 RepID=A0A8J4DS89_9ACTN|nr:precorrin-6y C5,15-methyltransferase (decarboxylating) subunit CbiE [Virgisporangium aliadipatigenens]GIJ47608.1 precorrin-6y C5,15-methyltransferase subunit CbiE [Virgisporangium aliadipatigenens]
MREPVAVLGVDGGALSARAGAFLAGATLVVGGTRHLSTVNGIPASAELLPLGNVESALTRIRAHPGRTVVLASGDPGFFGILRAIRRAALPCVVEPAISSVALAFARLGLPWDDAVVVSAHGTTGERALRRAVNACRAHSTVAVLTGPGAGPDELAAALPGRRLVVASRLGHPDERVGEYPDAADWPAPTVVLALPPRLDNTARAGAAFYERVPIVSEAGWLAGAPAAPDRWALPESAFEHRDSMITKAEIRALVLARLGPRTGDLVWDVGAGSGSVAVECARFGAAAVAVDRDADAYSPIVHNAAVYGVEVDVVIDTAPACLERLPDPDAVFVGGGGLDVLAACAARRPARLVAAFAAVERVGPALAAMTAAGYAAEGTQLQANRLSPLPDGTHRLAAVNPVTVLWGVLS